MTERRTHGRACAVVSSCLATLVLTGCSPRSPAVALGDTKSVANYAMSGSTVRIWAPGCATFHCVHARHRVPPGALSGQRAMSTDAVVAVGAACVVACGTPRPPPSLTARACVAAPLTYFSCRRP